MYKMNLEHLIQKAKNLITRLLGFCQKDPGDNLKRLPLTKDGTI